MYSQTIVTPISNRLGLQTPIFLAGMNVASGPELCAAVSNAGGLGSIGGMGYTPDFLRKQIKIIKENLRDSSLPFGVDLLLPKVGDGARATNYDYTEGKLPELVDIIIESGAKLFISAVGVPPRWSVEKFHNAGIFVMNMVGAPKHAIKACEVGVDIICAQGGEGGGHTGEIPTSILIPAVVDAVKDYKSPLTGDPVAVLAAGGIYDGRGLAMALSLGAQGIWVCTRFVAAKEAGAPPIHQKAVLECGFTDTTKTLVFTGRPLRIKKNSYVLDWEENRLQELKDALKRGTVPYTIDVDKVTDPTPEDMKRMMESRPWLMGQVAGAIHNIKPAADIMKEMTIQAVEVTLF